MIRRKVAGSGLYTTAEQQKGEFLVLLKAVVENAGWTFVDEVTPRDGRTRLKP